MRLLAPRHCPNAHADDDRHAHTHAHPHADELVDDEALELLPMKDPHHARNSYLAPESPVHDDGQDLEHGAHYRGVSPLVSSPATAAAAATAGHPYRPSRYPSSSAGSVYSKSSNKRRTTTAQSVVDAMSDPTKRVREKISVLAVIVHLCKGNIGPGAMSLPNGFSKTGIYAAPFYFVLVVRRSV
ncbi:hypothetical protein PINS_up005584 [Pythium insidiosum]|nr:hypothetical protein PINS_up005584 [Pythium insidiosum]